MLIIIKFIIIIKITVIYTDRMRSIHKQYSTFRTRHLNSVTALRYTIKHINMSEYTHGYLGGSQSGLTSGTWMRKRLVAMSVDTETSKKQ